MISGQFRLLRNIINKYRIQVEDLYNFDKIGFMMSVITAFMIITRLDRYRKAKFIQPDNRKWVTVIEYINVSGWCIFLFIIIKGTYHLSNWIIDLGFLDDWLIKPTANKWTNNETGLN